MDLMNLLNPAAAAIVVGGTGLATVLRCGFADCRTAFASIRQLGRRRFNAVRVRSELAVQIQEIQQDGLIRAHPHHFGDREFDEVASALIGSRSISALLTAHENHKRSRLEASNRAVRVLAQSADLAPVFGLAGTLLSLSQLPVSEFSNGDYTIAISMAVLTTLYGVLLANLLLAPLSHVIERAALSEERERQTIVDWLAQQLTSVVSYSNASVRDEGSEQSALTVNS